MLIPFLNVLTVNVLVPMIQLCFLDHHTQKTKYMVFGTNHALHNFDNISLSYGNDTIERVSKVKYLGVIFNAILAWNEHILIIFLLLFLNEWVLFPESSFIFIQPL